MQKFHTASILHPKVTYAAPEIPKFTTMNKHLITALLLCFSMTTALQAQCPVGPYIVTNQATLNNFPALYPQCEALDGLVVNQSAAFNLSPLASIKKINGNASFIYSVHFLSLSGMNALKEIAGTLTIDDMDSVLDFSGLEALERIGGDFIVIDNSELVDFDGFFSLKEIGGSLRIENNSKLTTLSNTHSILYLGVTPKSDLIIMRNPVLLDLNGLQGIKEVKGKLVVQSNKAMKNLDGLSGISLVDSTVTVYLNDTLENTGGLRNLVTCNGAINVTDNKSLKTVDFKELKYVKNRFSVSSNPELRSLDGANGLVKFEGDLYIYRNLKLDTIRAFNGLVEAGKLLDISINGPLPNYGFLASLKTVSGSFNMGSAFPVAYTGLESLSHVGVDLSLQTNAASLAGLENLKYVGRRLYIGGDSLKSVAALAKLDTVRELTVTYCPRLTSLAGIDNIDASSMGQVLITFNSKLNDCAVKSICDFQKGPGKLYVNVNTGNCADTAAVRRSCSGTDLAPPKLRGSGDRAMVKFERDGLDIHLTLERGALVGIRVYDVMGNTMAVRPSEWQPRGEGRAPLPIRDLKRGIYWVEVQIDADKAIEKVSF